MNLLVQIGGEPEVQGVFTSFKELVIMNFALAPEDGLVPEDIAPFIERMVFRTPEDAAGVGISWSQVMVENPGVVSEGLPVIIPVAGHREGIGGEGTEIGMVQCHDRLG